MHPNLRAHVQLRRPSRRALRRCARGLARLMQTVVIVLCNLAAVLGILAAVASHRPVQVGDWIEAQLAERLTQRLERQGLAVEIGAFSVELRQGLVPVITARDVELRRGDDAAPLVRLDAAEIVLHRDSALIGLPRPKALRLSGLAVTVVTGDRGTRLALDQAPMIPAVTSFGAFFTAVEAMFDRPGLERLDLVDLQGIALSLEDRANGWTWRSRAGHLVADRREGQLRLDLRLARFGDLLGRGDDGSITVSLAATPATGIGQMSLRAHGVNPAVLLPSDTLAFIPEVLRIDAPMALDLKADVLPGGTLGPMRGRIAIGEGLVPMPGGRVLALDHASARVLLSDGQTRLSLSEISVDSDLVAVSGTAQAMLAKTPLGVLREITGQVSLRDLRVSERLGFSAPLEAPYVEAVFSADRATRRITLGPSSVVTAAGPVVSVRGYVQPPESVFQPGVILASGARPAYRPLPEGWTAALDLAVDGMSLDQLVPLWPEAVVPKARSWLSKTVEAGKLSDARLALRLPPEGEMETAFSLHADQVRFRPTTRLPAFEDAEGFVSLDAHRLAARVHRAVLPVEGGAPVVLTDAVALIEDLRSSEAVLRVESAAGAPIPNVLRLLNWPVFRGGDTEAGLPFAPDDITGTAAAHLGLSIRLRHPEGQPPQIRYDGTGRLTDVASSVLLPGRTVTAAALAVRFSSERVAISGPVASDGLPAEVTWQRDLTPGTTQSRIEFTAPMTREALASFGLPLKPGEMQGAGRVSGTVVLETGQPPRLSLDADLTGASLRLAGLGWRKGAEQGGTVHLEGNLGKAATFDVLQIDAPGLKAQGRLRLAASGGLARLQFDRLQIGRWLRAQLAVSPARGGKMTVDLGAGQVDLRALPKGGNGESPISAVSILGTDVVVDDKLRLAAVAGALDLTNGVQGTLNGRVNGATAVEVALTPSPHGTKIHIRGPDAGRAARDAGYFEQGRGGTLDLTLTPTGDPGSYRGSLDVQGITLHDAPFATSILSAISIVGIAEQIGAGGIYFGSVDAEFLITPGKVIVSQSSAIGPSLGLALDGTLDVKAKTMDMQGVVSPFYFVNRLIGGLTPKGEGLVGIMFDVTGPLSAPKTHAKLHTLLVPGVFRDIFRRDPPVIDPVPEAAE